MQMKTSAPFDSEQNGKQTVSSKGSRDLVDALLGLGPVHGKVELIRVAFFCFALKVLHTKSRVSICIEYWQGGQSEAYSS